MKRVSVFSRTDGKWYLKVFQSGRIYGPLTDARRYSAIWAASRQVVKGQGAIWADWSGWHYEPNTKGA